MIKKYMVLILLSTTIYIFTSCSTRETRSVGEEYFDDYIKISGGRNQYSKKDVEDYYYTYYLAGIIRPVNSEERRTDYANAVEEFSSKYGEESRVVSRIIFKESQYKRLRKSYEVRMISNQEVKVVIACGPMAVRPYYWGHVPYKLSSRLRDRMLYSKNPTEEVIAALCQVRLGIESGCFVLSNYLHKNKWDYRHALTDYWAGQNSQQAKDMKRRNKSNHYVNAIYDGEIDVQIRKWYPKIRKLEDIPYEEKRRLYEKYH
jgi:hypothetical protein